MWIATDTVDYIVYQRETSPSHQDHIILHEVGHILADHTSEASGCEFRQILPPDTPRGTINRALRRTAYDEESECEAELVATIILEWSSVLNHVTPRTSEDPALGPLRSALHPRWGWM
ncbi:hypothetical protein [Streptomyces hygroscopicus]|uniref:hypothetical protein n=1 Tax=Streptomyces hygroscopicus TaxID=1912 RepID=UPI00224026C5|nr:hypothetical protein [Streptomyces hygroscopicus]